MKNTVLSLLLLGSIATLPVAAQNPEAPVAYDIAIEDRTVSVHATEGSLLGLVRELGQRLGFEVIAQGVEDTAVTVDFEQLNEWQAIRAICQRVGYVQVPDPATGEIERIVLTPSRIGRANRLASRLDPLPPPAEEPIEDPFASPATDEDPPAKDDAGASIP